MKQAYIAVVMLMLIVVMSMAVEAHERPGPFFALEPVDHGQEDMVFWPDRRVPVAVRGIYLTGYTAGNPQQLAYMLDLVERTELNAMVIDVKNSTGKTTYLSMVPLVQEIGAYTTQISDLRALTDELRSRGVYSIARLVVFQDLALAQARPDLAIQRAGGGIWYEKSYLAWVDPHSREVWDYVLDIAREVALAGFDEIQFDYVRFPSDGPLSLCVYSHADGRTRSQVISEFLSYCHEELSSLGVFTSADIYGLVPTAIDDLGIGQQYEALLPTVDYLCPMVYPSHYGPGIYGLPDPNSQPYETVLGTMLDAARRNENGAIIRPWLQDFSMGYRYGAAEVRAQINAVYDAGFEEWLLWNPANIYSENALLPSGD